MIIKCNGRYFKVYAEDDIVYWSRKIKISNLEENKAVKSNQYAIPKFLAEIVSQEELSQ